MEINKFYPLKAWLVTIFFTAFVCACWPDIRMYPDKVGPESLEYKTGFFFGILVDEFEYSATILIGLWLLFFLLTAKIHLSGMVVKSVLFILFLISVFITSHFHFQFTWLHPYFLVYSVAAAVAFCVFDVYRFDWEYMD